MKKRLVLVLTLLVFVSMTGCGTIVDESASDDGTTNQSATIATQPPKQISRVNYYDSDDNLMFYDSYAYYDNGLLCSKTSYEVSEYSEDGSVLYTLLYLYDKDGIETDCVFGSLQSAIDEDDIDEERGEVLLLITGDDGYTRQRYFYPKKESIAQEKFGVDPSKTEEVYGEAPTVPSKADGNWAQMYLQNVFANKPANEPAECRLIYIDDNDIPELYVDYRINAFGAQAFTTDGNRTDNIGFYPSGLRWIDRENRARANYGHSDYYRNDVYQVQDGKFTKVGAGQYGALDTGTVQRDENNYPIYDYYWNDVKMSREEYEQSLADAFDESQSAPIPKNVYSYGQCKAWLQWLADSAANTDSVT